MNLTPEQIAEVYNLITSQNKVFVEAMAEHAIKTSAAVKADMWEQMDDPKPQPPAEGDVKDMAVDYFSDMLADFEQAFQASVKSAPVSIHYELVPKFVFGGQ